MTPQSFVVRIRPKCRSGRLAQAVLQSRWCMCITGVGAGDPDIRRMVPASGLQPNGLVPLRHIFPDTRRHYRVALLTGLALIVVTACEGEQIGQLASKAKFEPDTLDFGEVPVGMSRVLVAT